MKKSLGKWEQHVLLQQDPFVAKHIPETVVYSEENLDDLLNRHPSVFVKHETTGQGRAIFKIRKSNSAGYYINGFTLQGTPIQKFITKVNELRQLLHPFIAFGRESGRYIIQEDIQSCTQNGQPIAIRVHIQKLNNIWVIGGMYGTTAIGPVSESGIVNLHRGAVVMTVPEVLSQTKVRNQKKIVNKIEDIALAAAQTIYSVLPNREYGMDVGINREGIPILFEVNTTPGIGGFAQMEDKAIWRRIVAIRKMQREP
ncbi:YheC/YheD family protein [Sporosarcina koreensis]|uniref:YheC/YheD family protein n=1 Tax=Sporosarcina koreensis TaxID=334735 RepID=A0ABW0TWH6_9BACL